MSGSSPPIHPPFCFTVIFILFLPNDLTQVAENDESLELKRLERLSLMLGCVRTPRATILRQVLGLAACIATRPVESLPH